MACTGAPPGASRRFQDAGARALHPHAAQCQGRNGGMRCPVWNPLPEWVAASADGACHNLSPTQARENRGAGRDLQAMFAGPGKLRAGERRGAPRHTRGEPRAGSVGGVLGEGVTGEIGESNAVRRNLSKSAITRRASFGRSRSQKHLPRGNLSRLSAQRECGQAAMCVAAEPRST